MSELLFKEEGHEYFHDGQRMLNVTSILEAVGITDFSQVDHDILEASKGFGRNVHTATLLDDHGDLDEAALSDPLRPYLAAWRKYKHDYNVKIIASETMVHSHIYGFCGTLDRVLEIKNLRLTLVDLKSGQMYPGTALQTAAYALAYEEQTGNKISYRRGLQLKGNGAYDIKPYKQKTDRMYFLAALKVCQYRKERGLL